MNNNNIELYDQLLEAIDNHDIDTVRILLDRGVDINIPNHDTNPLIEASGYGYNDIVQLLLDRGADVDITNSQGTTPLIAASAHGMTETVRLLLENEPFADASNEYGDSALILACLNTNIEIVQMLLEYGATINNDIDRLIEADDIRNRDIIRLLTVNFRYQRQEDDDLDPYDQLFENIKQGNLAGVQRLVNQGINVNHVNDEGATPLDVACSLGHVEIVRLLLKKGATISDMLMDQLINDLIENQEILTLLFPTAVRDGNIELIQYLLDKGVDVNYIGEYGSGLFIATLKVNREVIQLLLDKGANPNLVNNNGMTPLSAASMDNHKEIVELLLNNNPPADPNIPDKFGYTALYNASENGNTEIVQLLLNTNADPNIPVTEIGHERETALYVAVMNRQIEIVQMLLQNGATITDKIRDMIRNMINTDEIDVQIIKLLGLESDLLWKGWTRADIEHFHTVFLDQVDANNNAVCPICLKYTLRQDGCMYMNHNCTLTPGFYHKELYQKYKDEVGNIHFCTICGRICSKGHSHYHLNEPKEEKPPLYPSGDYFENDCRISNHGGGLPEKVTRFIAMRDKAIELNQQIDQITKQNALTQLVEAAWVAPLDGQKVANATRQLQTKKFNRPNTNFPVSNKLKNNTPLNLTTLPNRTRPPFLREFVPILHRFGHNAISLTDFLEEDEKENYEPKEEDKLIEFRHPKLVNSTIQRNKNEILFYHPGQLISRDTLHLFIQSKLGQFKTDESAGMCPFYPSCPSRLYPEEIRGLVPDELYDLYRLQFNFKFHEANGGKKRVGKTRKNQKISGGRHAGLDDIFTEMTNGACFVSPRKKGGKWKSRKVRKQKKQTKRHKKQKKQKTNKKQKTQKRV